MRVLWLGIERAEPVLKIERGLGLLGLLWVLLEAFTSVSSRFLGLGGQFGSFYLIPTGLLPLSCFIGRWTVSGEVSIYLAYPALERKLYII